jgi:hypothetical protein
MKDAERKKIGVFRRSPKRVIAALILCVWLAIFMTSRFIESRGLMYVETDVELPQRIQSFDDLANIEDRQAVERIVRRFRGFDFDSFDLVTYKNFRPLRTSRPPGFGVVEGRDARIEGYGIVKVKKGGAWKPVRLRFPGAVNQTPHSTLLRP